MHEAQQVGLASADEACERHLAEGRGHVRAVGRQVGHDGDETEPEGGDERGVELGRHAVQHHHGIARTAAEGVEQRGATGRRVVQLGKRGGAGTSVPHVDEGRRVAVMGGTFGQPGGDVHGSTREKRA